MDILISKTISKALFLIVVVLSVTACVATIVKKPFYVSDQFKPNTEQAITVLPPIKLGVAPDLDTEFDVDGRVKPEIINRGYKFIDKTKISLPVKVTPEMLDKLDFNWINKLNLEKNTWVLVIVIETLKRQQYGLGLRADSILSGYLFHHHHCQQHSDLCHICLSHHSLKSRRHPYPEQR